MPAYETAPQNGSHAKSGAAKHNALVRPVRDSALKGRARFKVLGLYRRQTLKEHLEHALDKTPFIVRADASIYTGNLLVVFDKDKTTDEISQLVIAAVVDGIRQLPKRARRPGVSPGIENPLRSVTGYVSDKVIPFLKHYRQRAHAKTGRERTPRPKGPQFARQQWHTLVGEEALKHLESAPDGLTQDEADSRLAIYGPNALPQPTVRSELGMVLEQFNSLPVALLGSSALISVLTGGVADAAVILGVVMINAGIGYVTERQAEKTISALTKIAPRSATVWRNGQSREVAVTELVPGDVVEMAPGAYVAADMRLTKANKLMVDESSLTGESMPVLKSVEATCAEDAVLAERNNMAYMGTMITGGAGYGVVAATGINTELGHIQTMVGETKPPDTLMQQQLDSLGTQLALISGAVCAGVFVVGLLRGYSLLNMLKTSISLAVAAVPEGLPAVATTTLALGIRDMSKQNVAIRHIDAVETLGSVQVFCLDKTGTLTINKMSVVEVFSGGHRAMISNGRFLMNGKPADINAKEELTALMKIAALCSDAQVRQQDGQTVFEGSSTETALVELAAHAGLDVTSLRDELPRVKIRYRSEGRPYMRTVHKLPEGRALVAVKGSPAEVLAKCDTYMVDSDIRRLDGALRDSIIEQNERMAGDSLRVLGLAYAHIDIEQASSEARLTWLGLAGMADPLRTGMKDLMRLFHRAGIKTVMITGDQSATAYAVGKQLGISGGRDVQILDSVHLENMDAKLLSGLVHKVDVFSRVSPANKLHIVQAMQKAGYTVAMTGDGINDGPALKAANIGVAMGESGTDVARSVSDVVLKDDNLHTMVTAVSQGRTIYGNIRKTIHYLLSTNLSEIEVMLSGVALGMTPPLNPMQLLWINLISDIFPGLARSMEPPDPDTLKRPPRCPEESIIRKQDLKRMVTQSAIISSGSLAAYAYGLLRYGGTMRAGTMAFNTLTCAQLLHALSCRSEQHGIFHRQDHKPPNPQLNLAVGGTFVLQALSILIPGMRKFLGTTPVNALDALVIAAGSGVPFFFNEALKPGPAKPTHPGEIKP